MFRLPSKLIDLVHEACLSLSVILKSFTVLCTTASLKLSSVTFLDILILSLCGVVNDTDARDSILSGSLFIRQTECNDTPVASGTHFNTAF